MSDSASKPHRPQPVVSVVSTSTSTALRVDYDGRYPPLELFFVWTSLGWTAPVPASPPRDAIDWSTPDVARGTSHTIRRFAATGTATLDSSSRVDADDMAREALDAAVRLGCRVDEPAPAAEIDLRDPPPAESAALPSTQQPSTPRLSAPRVRRPRSGRGAVACVRAIVPTSSLAAVNHAAASIAAEANIEDEPTIDPEAEPRSRVTFEVPASTADSAMRVLASLSIGTPTIEIVTARALAERRG